jgi:hypothetical protein
METKEYGILAKQVIDNPAFKRAMMEVKADLFDEWSRQTVWDGKKKREKLWDMMQAANKFESKLLKSIESARVAAQRDEAAKKRGQLKYR